MWLKICNRKYNLDMSFQMELKEEEYFAIYFSAIPCVVYKTQCTQNEWENIVRAFNQYGNPQISFQPLEGKNERS